MAKTFLNRGITGSFINKTPIPTSDFLYDSLCYGPEKIENSGVCCVFPLVIPSLFREEINFLLKRSMCNEYEFFSEKNGILCMITVIFLSFI